MFVVNKINIHMSYKNFCILPFIHLATTTEGNCRLCCKVSKHNVIRDNDGIPYNINTHSVDEIWNSTHMKNRRQRILNDERLPECDICFDEEDKYYTSGSEIYPSKRRRENQKWVQKNEFDDTVINNPKIKYYDIRLGNLCNLKCRMCWPQFSSQIVKEHTKFEQSGDKLWYNNFKDINENWATQEFWDFISTNRVDIEEITFVGGEPTLHEEMYDFLKQVTDDGSSKNIRLKITTNLTNLQERLLEYLPQFKKVTLDCSIDGVGKVQEYIRNPSDWETIDRNMNRILELNSNTIILNISTVVQVYNLFDLGNLVDWYIEKLTQNTSGLNNVQLMLNKLYDPNYLSMYLINKSARKEWYYDVFVPTNTKLKSIIDNIEDYDENDRWKWKEIEEVRLRILSIAKELGVVYVNSKSKKEIHNPELDWSDDIKYSEQTLKDKFIAYTKQLDRHRKENIEDIIQIERHIL